MIEQGRRSDEVAAGDRCLESRSLTTPWFLQWLADVILRRLLLHITQIRVAQNLCTRALSYKPDSHAQRAVGHTMDTPPRPRYSSFAVTDHHL